MHRANASAAEEGEEVVDQRAQWRSLEVQDYGPFFVQDYTQFFTTADPLDYFESLHMYLSSENVQPAISDEKLSLKFEATLEKRQVAAAGGEEEEKKEEAEPESRRAVVQI